MKIKLLELLIRAKRLSPAINHDWLDDVENDIENNRVTLTHIAPILRGYVRGLHAAGLVDGDKLYEFEDRLQQETGLMLMNDQSATEH